MPAQGVVFRAQDLGFGFGSLGTCSCRASSAAAPAGAAGCCASRPTAGRSGLSRCAEGGPQAEDSSRSPPLRTAKKPCGVSRMPAIPSDQSFGAPVRCEGHDYLRASARWVCGRDREYHWGSRGGSRHRRHRPKISPASLPALPQRQDRSTTHTKWERIKMMMGMSESALCLPPSTDCFSPRSRWAPRKTAR